MRRYVRVMLGPKSNFANECFAGGFIAAGFIFGLDLTGKLPDEWRAFNTAYIPVCLEQNPGKTKVAAGLNCGALWTICKGLNIGDMVLCPDGQGSYHVGEISGDYVYAPDTQLPHHRPVKWLDRIIARSSMSEQLARSSGSASTVSDVTKHAAEIEQLIGHVPQPASVVATDPEIEDPVAFAMEKHLEDFLVANWASTVLSKDFDIFQEDGELVGQQYLTDVGPIDILATSKDKKRFLVVELKRGRASDVVVGQLLRYMGYIKEQVAEPGQSVEGVIVALDSDPKLRYALAAMPNVSFYRYQVSFKLVLGDK